MPVDTATGGAQMIHSVHGPVSHSRAPMMQGFCHGPLDLAQLYDQSIIALPTAPYDGLSTCSTLARE